jgi:hypothetical protein
MEADLPDDALVIRFRPTDPAAVLNWASKEYRRTGYYRLSVFATPVVSGETAEQAVTRLLKASELSGIDPRGNPRYFVCTRAATLRAGGFTFWKDGEDDEVEEHYSIDLGERPSEDDVRRFLAAFDQRAR